MMNDADVSKQIHQMVKFIRQEADEKANEISISAEEIQKAGSVGRSIDVSSFKNYDELCGEIEKTFGLEGLLNDSRGSGWKLVYVDFEKDVLLVGDDPWEEFVGCVRCIRILPPSEVQQKGEEGMQLLNSNAAALQAGMSGVPVSDDGVGPT